MEISGAAFAGTRAQAFAQFVGALRAGEQAFEQRAQVKAGAADHDGKMPALAISDNAARAWRAYSPAVKASPGSATSIR